MRTHARYEQNGQPPRKTMKVKAEKIKAENKLDEPAKLTSHNNINNNNDISMFNQNSLENINELRMKIQENLLANGGLGELSNLKREIKIEFWGRIPKNFSSERVSDKLDTIIYDIFMIDEKRLIIEMLSWEEVKKLPRVLLFDIKQKLKCFFLSLFGAWCFLLTFLWVFFLNLIKFWKKRSDVNHRCFPKMNFPC